MTRLLNSIALLPFLVVLGIQGFTPFNVPSGRLPFTSQSCLEMAKRKMSMTEKRKQRTIKAKGDIIANRMAGLSKSNLDFRSTTASLPLPDKPHQLANPVEAAAKAQQLLQAQRASVDMLTMVRERVEALPVQHIMSALDSQGYFVMDDFLGDSKTLASIEEEARGLYDNEGMEVDMENLGSGEYTVAVKGGNEQYIKCPRTVEWVVATTKHIPETFQDLSLDGSACMATLRTFDRKALLASTQLLTGSEGVPEIEMPYSTVANDDDDKRRLTLLYYIIPESWGDACGGGIVFERSGAVAAKRDRMVLWKSESSSFRSETWKGDDMHSIGSCIELHLVGKSK